MVLYDRDGDDFNFIENPTPNPSVAISDCAYSQAGNFLILSFAAPPYIDIWKRTGTNFSLVPTLVDPPPAAANSLALSGDGNYLGIATVTSPYMRSYKVEFPFDSTTSFLLPDRGEVDASTSVVDTFSFIKAKP
jgi:hypothetical protein